MNVCFCPQCTVLKKKKHKKTVPPPRSFPHTQYFLLSVQSTEVLGFRCLWPTTLRQSHKQGLSKTLVRIEGACMFGGGDRPQAPTCYLFLAESCLGT